MTKKLIIASDLHGSPERTAFLCERVQEHQPDALILLGDLLYHGPRNPLPSGYMPMDAAGLYATLTLPVVAVRGNCDSEADVNALPFPLQEHAWILTDTLQIFACHGHSLPLEPPFKGIPPGTVVLRGHSHIPLAHSVKGVHLWNPGSLTLPKNGFPPSWAMYEGGEFRVMDMSGTVILRHKPAEANTSM